MLGSDFTRDSIFSEVAIVPNLAFFFPNAGDVLCGHKRHQNSPHWVQFPAAKRSYLKARSGTRFRVDGSKRKISFKNMVMLVYQREENHRKKGSDNFWLVVLTTNQSKIWLPTIVSYWFMGCKTNPNLLKPCLFMSKITGWAQIPFTSKTWMSAVVDAGTIDRTWHGDNWEAAASGMAMARKSPKLQGCSHRNWHLWILQTPGAHFPRI